MSFITPDTVARRLMDGHGYLEDLQRCHESETFRHNVEEVIRVKHQAGELSDLMYQQAHAYLGQAYRFRNFPYLPNYGEEEKNDSSNSR